MLSIYTILGPFKDSATQPNPSDNATDVYREVVINWGPGEFADTHNLFFGTDFNDVNEATIAEPLGVTAAEGLNVNNFDPGILEYGVTYYWRVDEVTLHPIRANIKEPYGVSQSKLLLLRFRQRV